MMNQETQPLASKPSWMIKAKYYGKLLLYVIGIGFCLSALVKIVGFLLLLTSSNSSLRSSLRAYFEMVNIDTFLIQASLIPLGYYLVVRLLLYINKRNEIK